MNNQELLVEIAKELGLTVRDSFHALNRQLLAGKINELIKNDFQRLVSILYRMDISESKLKLLLKDNPGLDAGIIIADLMIERQAEKIKSRQQFSQQDKKIDENEKW